jgi:GMP synthase (glutamine-hydrolysing)
MRLAVIQHNEIAPPGLFADHLPAGTVVVRLDRDEKLPDPRDYEGIVVLGGIMGAYDVTEYPVLGAEKEMLRAAVAEDVPVLGICLGCQLLADALGGAAYLAPRLELVFAPLTLTDAGADDPVAAALAQPVLSFHQDTWDLPPGATLLASSEAYPQAFRLGSAVGLQPHPEATPEIVATWIGEFDADRIAASGSDPGAVLAAMTAGRETSVATAERIFSAWMASLG